MSTRSEEQAIVVADIGETSLRVGLYRPASSQLVGVRRSPTPSFLALPGRPVEEIQARVLDELAAQITACAAAAGPGRVAAVGVAFAGPINAAGDVTAAPTIWGGSGPPVPLAALLARRIGLPVHVVNDMSAVAWRYARTEPEPFCVITVSSGVGNKVFRDGDVLLGPDGEGGEIGHFRCDAALDAPLCDCGRRGHLGAITSGRGVVDLARRAAERDPHGFTASALGALAGTPAGLTSHRIAEAVRAGDAFALAVLRDGIIPLAGAMALIYSAIGVRRFIIVGGFALAIGAPYLECLRTELQAVGCFGLDDEAVAAMVRLGEPDDDHALIGVGRYVAARPPGPAAGAVES